MSSRLTLVELRNEIAETLAEWEKAYDLPDVCVALGLEHGTEEEAFSSKRAYVRTCTKTKNLSELVELGEKLLERYPELEKLENMIARFKTLYGGVDGEFKNLIFSADGPKPELVLTDALNNTIEIVKNAELCLAYNLSIGSSGLLWIDLVKWWADTNQLKVSDKNTDRSLYKRLIKSLTSKPEIHFFQTYFRCYYDTLGTSLPALIPQVYLHYGPKSVRELSGEKRLMRQRMDFLMLLPNNQRIVIEIDGKQHYSSSNGSSSPKKYSEMVAEDRKLRLTGYEVYRFGGYELTEDEKDKSQSGKLIHDFFERLFKKHKITSRP